MISIIICSINKDLYNQVCKSISDTIGIAYELIKIDNAIENYGICKAYNIGAYQAKYPFLCFLHEDILIKSTNWGLEIVDFIKQNDNIGIVGIAGSAYKSLVPSVWAQGLYETDHVNMIQHYRKNIATTIHYNDEQFSEVKTLDGVFLFTKKEVWKNNNFDETTFDKFHCYDLDFCLQVGQKSKIFVFNNLLIEHFSSGSLNKDWVNYSIKLSEKWKNLLPIGDIPNEQKKDIEWRNRKIFFFRMNILGFPLLSSLKEFVKFGFILNFNFLQTISFLKDVVLRKFKITDKDFY